MAIPNRNEPKGVELKGKTVRQGLKLTPDLLKSHISEVIYEDREVGGHRVITCHLKMDNGFVVWGKNGSTSINPANFDVELGKKLAYEKTFSQLWELEAYRAVVEKQMLEVATADAKIDITQYISDRSTIQQIAGIDFLKGSSQVFTFHHSKDTNSRGICVEFFNTDNPRHDEEKNSKARFEVETYIRSHMVPEELYSELVVRLAKTCYAAYVGVAGGVAGDTRGWQDLSNIECCRICEQVRDLLLQPKGGLDTRLNEIDRVYKSIVDSYK